MSVPLSKSSVFPDEANEENEQGNGPEHGVHTNQANRVPTNRTLPGRWMNQGIDHRSNHHDDKQTHRNHDECKQPGQYALHVDHRVPTVLLNIQVLHVQRVVFDEFSAGFYVFAHQRREDGFALGDVFEPDLQEGAALGIHSRFPELLGGHFSEAFVALDDVLFAAFVQDVVEKIASGVFLYDLGLFRAARGWLVGSLLSLLGVFFLTRAQVFFFVIVLAVVFVHIFILVVTLIFIAAGLRLCRPWHALDHERRLKILLDLRELGDELPAFRSRGQFPVDDVLGSLRVYEVDRPQIVLFVEARVDAFQLQILLQALGFSFQFFDLLRRSLLVAFEVGALGEVEFRQ